MHARQSGVADHYATDDVHALSIVRRIVGHAQHPQTDPILPFAEPVVPSPITTPPSSTHHPHRSQRSNTIFRELIARLVDGSRIRRVQASLRHHAGDRLRATDGAAGGHQSPITAFFSRRAPRRVRISSNCAASAGFRCSSCRTSPASWSGAKYEAGGIAKERRQARHGGGLRAGAQADPARRRFLRSGELRHVRARLFAPLPLHLAEFAPSRWMGGEQAASVSRHGPARPISKPRASPGRQREEGGLQGPDPRQITRKRARPIIANGPAVG